MNEKWFLLSVAQIEQKLKTNAASGLSRKAARSAWRYYYPKTGQLFIRKKKPLVRLIGELLSDFALILLLMLSVLAILFDDRNVGGTVLTVSLVGIIISTVCYYRCQRIAEATDEYFLPTAKVIRGGKLYRVAFENVVPGDVVLLERGDIVCADCRIVTSDDLDVEMRVELNKYIPLKKQATSIIDENENNPAKYMNILHAGSVIEKGSARAIAYATGRFTYLGARTGGIYENHKDNAPQELVRLKKICSRISIISMISILPFSISSMLFSHISGGTSTLSIAFLTALSLAASSFKPFACTVCRLFYVKKIKEMSKDNDPVVVRSCDTLDKLMNVKHIFMLDSCAVSDGVLHFDGAFTAEGDVKSYESYTPAVQALFDFSALYNSAESKALSVGGYDPHRFETAFGEFLSQGKVDVEALKISHPIRSYIPGTDSHPIDRVFFTDNNSGKKMVLGVSHSTDILSCCSYAIIGGRTQPLSSVGADRLKHTYNMHTSRGKKVLLFTVSSLENDATHTDRCFVGGIVLHEQSDRAAFSSISVFNKRGINVISFVGNNIEVPVELCVGKTVSKNELVANGKPLSYDFGVFNTYCGFDEGDILELLRYAHRKGETVGVISLSDLAPHVISEADVFISCSSLVNVFSAKSEHELYTLEMAGMGTSKSGIQIVRAEADVLIERPSQGKGGISTLLKAISRAESACKSLNDFFRYIIGIQIVRLLVVGIPMIFGRAILDARHILVCSFLIDPLVLIAFALDRTNPRISAMRRINTLRSQLRLDMPYIITTAVISVLTVILPIFVDNMGFMGAYLYRVEYMFFAMLWLNMAVIYYVRYGSVTNIKRVTKNKYILGVLAGIAVCSLALVIFDRLGLVFEMVYQPLPYAILTLVPAFILLASTSLMTLMRKNK